MAVNDVIEREMVLSSTRSEVWAALTTAEGLAGWWWDSVEIDLRPGGAISFGYGESVYPAQVETVQPEDRYVFTWRSFQEDEGAEDVPELTTQVEFLLEDHPDGTLLKLSETGFAALLDALAARSRHANESGWDEELQHLRTYVVSGEAVVRG